MGQPQPIRLPARLWRGAHHRRPIRSQTLPTRREPVHPMAGRGLVNRTRVLPRGKSARCVSSWHRLGPVLSHLYSYQLEYGVIPRLGCGPADVAVVAIGDQHRPFDSGPLDEAGVHRPIRLDGAAGGVAAVHVCACITRVLENSQESGVGQDASAQLPGPYPTYARSGNRRPANAATTP